MISLLELEGVAHRSTEGLPIGVSRLVEVGRAMAASPKLLMLDEPAAGLDTNERQLLAEGLQRVVEQEDIALFW